MVKLKPNTSDRLQTAAARRTALQELERERLKAEHELVLARLVRAHGDSEIGAGQTAGKTAAAAEEQQWQTG
eukprot:352743-Chlamydomonas_euryale.AAC.30